MPFIAEKCLRHKKEGDAMHRKTLLAGILFALTISWVGHGKKDDVWAKMEMKTLFGKPYPTQQLDKKLLLFVNVASKCGYTPQYASLQKLHETYKAKGLQVLGVPCNQFGGQEPGSPAEIEKFCKTKYSVDFPILQKQNVNGETRSPLYQHLISSSDGKNVRWNFEKILVSDKGKVIARFSSSVDPMSPELLQAIERHLPKASKKK